MFPETALVTGGASGIGAAIVSRLREEGSDVRVLDLADGFDVADPAAWETVEPVQLACLNAGTIARVEDVRELDDENYRRVLATNVDGVVFGVRRLADVLAEGSAIVVTASLSGLTTMVTDPIYSGTKHFLVGFVRSVAPQLAERGITINAVCPAVVDTPMVASVRDEVMAAGIGLIRPKEIADAALGAARDGSTGECWACLPGRPPAKHVFPLFFRSA